MRSADIKAPNVTIFKCVLQKRLTITFMREPAPWSCHHTTRSDFAQHRVSLLSWTTFRCAPAVLVPGARTEPHHRTGPSHDRLADRTLARAEVHSEIDDVTVVRERNGLLSSPKGPKAGRKCVRFLIDTFGCLLEANRVLDEEKGCGQRSACVYGH